jgi:hypothetical protein
LALAIVNSWARSVVSCLSRSVPPFIVDANGGTAKIGEFTLSHRTVVHRRTAWRAAEGIYTGRPR